MKHKLISQLHLFTSTFVLTVFQILNTNAAAPEQDLKNGASHFRPVFAFMENRGQITDPEGNQMPEVLYTARSKGITIMLTSTGINYQFAKEGEIMSGQFPDSDHTATSNQEFREMQFFRIDMRLINANSNAEIIADGQQAYEENFYLPDFPSGIEHVRSFSKITYKNIYPHIDWVITYSESGLKYDFIVYPGGDLNQIKINYSGTDDIIFSDDGTIEIKTPIGSITETSPVAWEQSSHKPITTKFISEENNMISFRASSYNQQDVLVIDPYLLWGTYYGGEDFDKSVSVAVDHDNNVYLSGLTSSLTGIGYAGFMVTVTEPGNAFLVKFDSSGVRQWGTYYGGSADEPYRMRCTVDPSGNPILAGQTYSTTGMAFAGFQMTGGGSQDLFIVKFNPAGERIWATFYGTTSEEHLGGIASDADGNIIVSGYTEGLNYITLNAYDSTFNGSSDAFLFKVDSSCNLLFSTIYGGAGTDHFESVATDNEENIYASGWTDSKTGIASGGYDLTCGCSHTGDAMLIKFNPAGMRIWGTYYGGTSGETADGVTVDQDDNVYIVGNTTSTSSIAFGGFQNVKAGGNDAYLVKFNASGLRLWATYFGGPVADFGYGVATDIENNVFITGYGGSTSGIAFEGFQNIYGGGTADGFVVKFNEAGERLWSSYYGGTQADYAEAVVCDLSKNVYISGWTYSGSGGIAFSGHQNIYGGNTDAFLGKIGPLIIYTAVSDSVICPGSSMMVHFNTTGYFNAGNIFTAELSDSSGSFDAPLNIGTIAATYSSDITAFIPAGQAPGDHYRIRVTGSDPSITGFDNGFDISVKSLPDDTIFTDTTPLICFGDSVVINSHYDPGYSYQWFKNGIEIPLATDYHFIAHTEGNYSVEISNGYCTINTALIEVIVLPVYSMDTSVAICDGDIFILPDGSEAIFAGTYETILSSITGCDSTINTTITVNPSYFFSIEATIETGETYVLPGGDIVNEAGIYVDSFSSVTGCDSIYMTTLSILDACDPVTGVFASMITASSVKINWTAEPGATKYQIWYRPDGAAGWQKKNTTATSKKLIGLTAGTVYQYKIKTICGAVSSLFTPLFTFTTPMRYAGDEVQADDPVTVFPNPNNGYFTLQINKRSTVNGIELYDISGRRLNAQINPKDPGMNLYEIELLNSISGIIVIKIEMPDKLITTFVVLNE